MPSQENRSAISHFLQWDPFVGNRTATLLELPTNQDTSAIDLLPAILRKGSGLFPTTNPNSENDYSVALRRHCPAGKQNRRLEIVFQFGSQEYSHCFEKRKRFSNPDF